MTDAYKNFIEFEAGTLPDTNVFYATIIATLNEQLKEANEIIKKCAEYCSVGCYYDERDEEMIEKDLDKFPVLKKAIEHYKETGGRSEEEGCIPNFIYFFKQMHFKFDQDPDEMFGWDSETADDFWSWGTNSRWANTVCMWIDNHLEECLEKAIELAKEFGDLDLEEE